MPRKLLIFSLPVAAVCILWVAVHFNALLFDLSTSFFHFALRASNGSVSVEVSHGLSHKGKGPFFWSSDHHSLSYDELARIQFDSHPTSSLTILEKPEVEHSSNPFRGNYPTLKQTLKGTRFILTGSNDYGVTYYTTNIPVWTIFLLSLLPILWNLFSIRAAANGKSGHTPPVEKESPDN